MVAHNKNCQCEICQAESIDEGMQRLAAKQLRAVSKHGFYAHLVPVGGGFVNAHTHLVAEAFDHDDFQIVLSIPPQTISGIFHDFVDRVKAGEQFKDGDEVTGIIINGPVKLINAVENFRHVLRVILPDPEGKLDASEMREPFVEQYRIVT